MVELSPGSVVTVDTPAPVLQYAAPGIVRNIWLKEGPPGAPGAPGADGEVTTAAMVAYAQPIDSDLTAIAALVTTSYGRALLTLADQAALMGLMPAASETTQGKIELATQAEANTGTDDARAVTPLKLQTRLAAYAQPLDSDLTAIAALTTTSYGRAFLALADAAAARTALALGGSATLNIGTTAGTVAAGDHSHTGVYQPLDTDLTAIAALVSAANKIPYATGSGTWALADLTAFARTILDDADAATVRATIDAASSSGGGREKSAALSATTGTCTGDLSAASIFTVTPTGNWTLAFSNVPASGTSCLATVIVTEGATPRTMTQPTGTKFMGAAAPTVVASKARIYNYETVDGGTTWYASAAVEQ